MEVKTLEGPFGAEVLGLDLAVPLIAGERDAASRAFAENVVLCFRGQGFGRLEQLLAAVRNLGEPMPPVTATYRLPGFDVIEELTNEATDRRTGDRTPLRRGGSWHTDHSNLECSPKAEPMSHIFATSSSLSPSSCQARFKGQVVFSTSNASSSRRRTSGSNTPPPAECAMWFSPSARIPFGANCLMGSDTSIPRR